VIGPFVIAGAGLQAVVWRLVATRRAPFWPAVACAWAVLGAAAVLFGDPRCCDDGGPIRAIGIGVASGIALYAATRIVVTFASRWPVVARSVEATYARSSETTTGVVWLVTLAVAVPGEELFWRGVATPWFVDTIARLPGGILAWLLSVAVVTAWSGLTFLAGAAVGGATWTALAVWTGGVVAPLASHLAWTACMLAWPPRRSHAKVSA